ncbi:putative leucine-rich repeat-containing protein DDB_G0290503 [Bombus flavifrons]|uniref:putative leucine-rich repeat-containing protein DDB_G0290503 n=1 Tax=Bombus flavifrons TaxID=103934 RepID=UPI003703C158
MGVLCFKEANAEPKTSANLMSRNLDTNTQEKSLENKDDKSLSPSMLDSSKRNSRYNVAIKPATSLKFGEIVYNQTRQSNTNKILRSSLKTKLIEDKSEIINKQKATENVENKLTKEEKRGIKQKLISDSESETTDARQRREVLLTNTASDSDRCKSVENDNAVTRITTINEANLSQRTRNKTSRLLINMVFDSPLSRSRQSKSCDDKKQPEEDKGASIAKREAKHRGRPRRSGKVEVKKNEDTRKILQNEKSGLEEQRKVEENTKEETVETQVNSKSILDNKGDLLDTERAIEINNTVQNIKFTKGRSHTQNDMEDVVEDSQELSNESKLSKIRIALNKIEDTKTILQNKKNSLEGEKEVGEKKKITNNKTRRNNISHKYEVDLLEQEKAKLNSCVSNLMEERDKLELKLVEIQGKVEDMDEQNNFLRKKLGNVQKLSKDREKHQEELGDIIKLHDEEKYKLIQHWCSVECQTAIKAYIDGKVHKESSDTESIKNAAINEVEQEIINKDPQIDYQCKKKMRNFKKSKQRILPRLEIIQDMQCQALIKTLGETFNDKDQTLHVTDTDTDLSKPVDSSLEIMVLTVETINDMNESTEENIVLTVHEKDAAVNSNEEFNLIDHAQESDETIIEVISTEIVAQEVSENCSQNDNYDVLNHTKTRNDSITPITSGVISDLETADDIDIK